MNVKILNRDAIKYIATLAMVLNHIASIFMAGTTTFRMILLGVGDFTAITMCYFLVEGYAYTHSKAKYAIRLFLFGVLSQIPYCLAFTRETSISFVGLNMLFTLFLCFLLCAIYENISHILLKIMLIALIAVCSMWCDWGIGGPVFTLLFLWGRDSFRKKQIAFLLPTFLFGIYNFVARLGNVSLRTCMIATIACVMGMGMSGICILYFYNGKKAIKFAKFSKWFFYIFYPLHLLLLALIRLYNRG